MRSTARFKKNGVLLLFKVKTFSTSIHIPNNYLLLNKTFTSFLICSGRSKIERPWNVGHFMTSTPTLKLCESCSLSYKILFMRPFLIDSKEVKRGTNKTGSSLEGADLH